jgi:hypothetical protein
MNAPIKVALSLMTIQMSFDIAEGDSLAGQYPAAYDTAPVIDST